MHTKTISTEKPLHRTVLTHVFYTKNIWHRETCTHRLHTKVFTDRLFCTQQFTQITITQHFFFARKPLRRKTYSQQFLQTDGFYTENFPHRRPTTEGFTHNIFYIQTLLHTDVFTQTQIAHRNLCTQHAFTHNQFLHREALLPLLDHLPFVFPLSIFFAVVQTDADVRETQNCQNRWWK